MNNLQKVDVLPRDITYINNIPPILHMIWVGDTGYPSYVIDALTNWSSLMPTWQIRLWTNSDITTEHFPEDIIHMIHTATKGAQKADIMRYFIVEKYGGVYVDADVIPCKSLEPIRHINTDIIICHDLPVTWNYISIGFFAAVPHHPILTRACQLCRGATINTADIHLQTGPRLFGEAVASTSDAIALLNIYFFYRNRMGDTDCNGTKCASDFEGRLGEHWYAKTW
jgi:mannosyltransferase OCH1-like enzyme